jgi:hypothetical protein
MQSCSAFDNPGGPGNPFARQVAALRSALVNKVTPEDIEDIVIILLLKAKQGDLAAVKLLFSYVLGKPADTVDPDRLDEQEWEQFKRNVVPGDHVPKVIGACHAELANGMARVTIPPVQDGIKRQLADILAVDLPVPLDPHTQARLDRMAQTPVDADMPDDEEPEPTPAVLPARPATVTKAADRLDRAANPGASARAAQRPKRGDDAPRRHQSTVARDWVAAPAAEQRATLPATPTVGKRPGRPGATLSDGTDGKRP